MSSSKFRTGELMKSTMYRSFFSSLSYPVSRGHTPNHFFTRSAPQERLVEMQRMYPYMDVEYYYSLPLCCSADTNPVPSRIPPYQPTSRPCRRLQLYSMPCWYIQWLYWCVNYLLAWSSHCITRASVRVGDNQKYGSLN
jgi:hypothetical protein